MLSEVICILPKEKEARAMEIKTTAANRKDLVKAVEQFTGERSVYLGPPTFAYRIGDFTVDRDSTVSTENEEKAAELETALAEQGFTAGTEEAEAESGTDSTTIKIPLGTDSPQAVINTVNLLHAKQYLINKAVGAERFKVSDALITSLENTQFTTADEAAAHIMQTEGYGFGFSFEDGCIVFSGFPYSRDSAEIKAYTELAAAMVKQAKEQKRISPKETIEENEKYYMRVWLVRLGFDGKEAKETRKVLLENLKGHTAFRTDADRQKWNERQKAKRAAAESGVE